MFSKVLVANRGLIQANCIRAVQELGAKAITIYEADDRNSAGVRNSDEAHEIKMASSGQAYSDIDQIVELAKRLKVDAVHSGYGFLAQNADFSRKLRKIGIVPIAPELEGNRNLADKPSIKQQAQELGLLALPGSNICRNYESVKDAAESIGYPLLIKAVHGYGGKGLRVVQNLQELKSTYEYVLSRCQKFSMNTDEVYLEKFFDKAHHIEFPLLRDKNGNTIVFPEQWCSVQRRFQKILVETPSRILSRDKRNKLTSVIRQLAAKLDIQGFASVVFLVDDEFTFFLKVNGYIQPFYSATSLLTGIDILKEQIRISSGEDLKARPERITKTGHVISISICAEDPENNFAPSPGKIDRFYLPFGQGIFVQSNVFSGDNVATFYDPMIAKVIVRERNRKEAIEKLSVALEDFFIDGIKTNIPFIRAILRSKQFKSREINLSIIADSDQRKNLLNELKNEENEKIAAMVAAISLHYDTHNLQIIEANREISQNSLWATASRWLNRKKMVF
jgi:acetyl/propionyl-CoA carboxylase alpha subunit